MQVDRGDEEGNVQLSFLINLYSLSLTSRDWSQRIIVTNSDKHGPVNWLHSTYKKIAQPLAFCINLYQKQFHSRYVHFKNQDGVRGRAA